MSLPTPHPGLVVRHSYLWHRESRAARESGAKDRPAAVLLVSTISDGPAQRVYLLPITHTPPEDEGTAIEIPQAIKRLLNLDAQRSWIMIDEVNDFIWPGFDLALIPGSHPPAFAYGTLPPTFFKTVRDACLALIQQKRLKAVRRDD